jgi:hypothetical protein
MRQRLTSNEGITHDAEDLRGASFRELHMHMTHLGRPQTVFADNPQREDRAIFEGAGKERNCIRRWFQMAKNWISGGKKHCPGKWVIEASRRASIE